MNLVKGCSKKGAQAGECELDAHGQHDEALEATSDILGDAVAGVALLS